MLSCLCVSAPCFIRVCRLAADAAATAPKELTQEIVRLKGGQAAQKEAALLALCSRTFKGGRTIVFAKTKQRAHRWALGLPCVSCRCAVCEAQHLALPLCVSLGRAGLHVCGAGEDRVRWAERQKLKPMLQNAIGAIALLHLPCLPPLPPPSAGSRSCLGWRACQHRVSCTAT